MFIISIFYISLNKDPAYSTKDLEGNKINNFQLEHFTNNKIISQKDLTDTNFTLINFWASWCGPCKIEHPFLLKLNEEEKMKIIGVNFKDKRNQAVNFLNNYGNPYDLLTKDTLGKQSVNFGIYGIPESILINKDLVIIKKYIGPIRINDYKEIISIIKND